MTRAILFACLLAALLPAGCGTAPPDGTAAERAVYEAFLAPWRESPNGVAYVVAATDAAWFEANPFRKDEWAPYLHDLGGIPMDLAEELYRINRTSMPIAEDPPAANFVLLPAGYAPPMPPDYDARCLFGPYRPGSGPDSDADCHVRPYYTLSRVAFSRDRRHALLRYRYYCLPLCASEGFVAFEWDGRRWRKIGRRLLWIS